MSRDLVGLALILGGCIKVWLAWMQVRSHRVKTGRWCRWPLSLEWLLAGAFQSVAVLLIILGWLLLRGSGPIEWWAVAIAANVAFWHFLLAWGLWHLPGEPPPAEIAVEQPEP